MVIADAIKRSGKLSGNLEKDRDKVRDALTKTDLKLSQGTIKFGPDGQVTTVYPSVVQVQLKDCQPDTYIIYPESRAAAKYETPAPWAQRPVQVAPSPPVYLAGGG